MRCRSSDSQLSRNAAEPFARSNGQGQRGSVPFSRCCMSSFSKTNRPANMEVLEQRQLLSTTLSSATAKPALKPQTTFIHPLDASVDTPTGLDATAASSAEIDLTWDAQSGVDGFVILRGTDNITFGTTLDTSGLTGSSTSFHDSTVSAGTKYYYEIEATSSGVDSDPSASVNATTPAAPVPPAGLAANEISSGEIDLSWTSESSVDGFVIKRGTDGITFGT